ncbi:MAG TPA: phosphoglycerate dehydrogenase [Gemmatimonadaceae bacterium]|nr:phosphoglycerate dehydrogenase [Gemmatimonadaceae bacterium]
MSDKIFVALSTFAERDKSPLDRLASSGHPYRLYGKGKRITPADLLAEAGDASVIIASVEPYDAATLAALPELRCISRCGAGVDSIDLDAARARGVAVLNTPDAPTAAVAESAITMFLALAKNLPLQSSLMRARRWERVETHLLGARTVGIVGLGRIGRRVAELCRAFGTEVIGYDPRPDPAWHERHKVRLVGIDELVATSDIVSLHAARSAESPFVLTVEVLARMKPGAAVVNLARGGMVDEDALARALESGHISGAALDVFSEEPYAGPLCDFPNVILTPHSAALAVETRAQMEMQAVENALRFLDGLVREDERVA